MYRTFEQLIQRTVRKLSQVDGTGVQIYAEDPIADKLQEAFNTVFSELWWPRYMQWFERTLDGTLGVVTVSLEDIARYEDIRAVFRDTRQREIPEIPATLNPYSLTSGTYPVYRGPYISASPDTTRRIQFYPKTSTGTVYIHARVHPGEFSLDDVVYMDDDLLTNAAAYMYAEDDGTNPGATQKFQNLFELRLSQLRKELNYAPFALDDGEPEYPDRWFEVP